MSKYHLRFVGADHLPRTLSEFDVARFFHLAPNEAEAIRERFRADRRLGVAVQFVFLRASGRPLDRFAIVPKTLLQHLAKELGVTQTSIASLRSMYRRRETLYDHQRWAREQLGLGSCGDDELAALKAQLRVQANDAASIDELVKEAEHWIFEQRTLLPSDRVLRDAARKAFAVVERSALEVIEAVVSVSARTICQTILFETIAGTEGQTVLEWLKTPAARHSPSTLAETMAKVRILKRLGAHEWNLDGIPAARQSAYARAIANRPPSESRRRIDRTQTLEVICFLRVTLLELSDTVVLLAGRRVNDLVRRAAGKADAKRAVDALDYRARFASIKDILRNFALTPEQRLAAIEQMVPDDVDPSTHSAAAMMRRTLTDEPTGVRPLLDGLRDLVFEGDVDQPALKQWQTWRALRERGLTSLPGGDEQPTVSAAWRDLVADPDRQRAFRAYEACTMTAMRKALRGGSVWLDHTASFRDRDRTLIPAADWKLHRDHYVAMLGQTTEADALLAPLLANARAGLVSVADALLDGKLTIDVAGSLHLPALEALDGEVVPKRTGRAIFETIDEQQLPDILIEVDARTDFSEALLGHKAASSDELLACYAGLLAHGTEIDAKGVAAMIPDLGVSQVSAAMRSLEASGRLRRANERVVEFQRTFPLATLWGPGDKASADMMSLDASQHLWNARVDPRRRSYAAGLYTHVLDRYGIVYDQPIVLNERQAGAAIAGVEHYNREQQDRLSMVAVDTHGYTHAGMAGAKLLGFDLCPRLRALAERKLYVPSGWRAGRDFAQAIEPVVSTSVALTAIRTGWDAMLRFAASIRTGRISANVGLRLWGSAAKGDGSRRGADELGRLLRTVFLCDYFTNPDFRRELHTLLNRGESVHQLQRAIYYGRIAPERGRRQDELIAISGAHALLTNIVIAWNTARMQAVVDRWRKEGMEVEDEWLRRLGPVHFEHINFRGTFSFAVQRYAKVLIRQGPAARQAARE
ncbi:Tn3 family transposase [Variovorax paradoxus]|nr:Tn3 family transposase [Variovorax paradoxus]MBT2303890.1 Tn3 family transposase [Variovorax paradoxus]